MHGSRVSFSALVALLLGFAIVSPSHAQVTSGSIEGWLVDADGNPVPFGNVVATGPNLQGNRGTAAQVDGYFSIPGLPVGTYAVTVTHISFERMELTDVVVRLGKATSLGRVVLAESVRQIDPVVVKASPDVIDPGQVRTGGTLDNDEYDALPLSRDYRSISTLLPEVNGSFLGDGSNHGGSTGLENRYYVDGIEVTDPFRGITGTQLPYNFIRGVEVRTGGYQAEFRGSLGGAMDAVTYSGSNEIHGSVFGFFANNQLAGDPRLGVDDNRTGGFSLWDVGGGLRGPLVRDRLWFNLAYNPLFRSEDVRLPGLDVATDETVAHRIAGSLRWRPSDKTSLGLRVVGDPNSRDGVGERLFVTLNPPETLLNPDPYLGDISTSTLSNALQFDWFASESFLFEADGSLMFGRNKYVPATETGADEINFFDARTLTESGGYPMNTDDRSVYGELAARGTWLTGEHTVKGGLEFRDNYLDSNLKWTNLTVVDEPTSSTGELYTLIDFDITGDLHSRGASVFLQDSWRAGRRWRINAGLRWDSQFWIDSAGKQLHSITDQWQPRLGVTFQPGDLGSHKIFASAGRFYHDVSTAALAYLLAETHVVRFQECSTDPRVDPSTCAGAEGDYVALDPSVKGQYSDEVVLGYEGGIAHGIKGGMRGVYRRLGRTIEDGLAYYPPIDDVAFVWGNPGSGLLSDYPEARREYWALVLEAETAGDGPWTGRASYVLSRNEGNHPGLYNSDYGIAFPNSNASFDYPELLENGDGLLPNDRTHVVKLSGSYRTAFGLTTGGFFQWASGTPRSLLEGWVPPYFLFSQQRGTYGRTSSIWDLNLRFTYDLQRLFRTSTRPLVIVDLFHVASQRKAVVYDDLQSFSAGTPNLGFGEVVRFQPPMAVRLGVEVGF